MLVEFLLYFLLTPERASYPLNRMYTIGLELTCSVTKENEGCCVAGMAKKKMSKYNLGEKEGLMGRCQYALNCEG